MWEVERGPVLYCLVLEMKGVRLLELHKDVFSPSLDKPRPETGQAWPACVCDARTCDSTRYQVSREHTDLLVEDQRGISHPE